MILLVLCCTALTANRANAGEGCPDTPANGRYWSVDELNDVWGQYTQLSVCCCLRNVLGPWDDKWHSSVLGGCDCPSIPGDWVCFQVKTIYTRDVTPVSTEGRIIPPPPPGGWESNQAATHQVQVDCNCTDQNGDPTPSVGCVVMRSNYVPVLYAQCTDC